MRADQTTLAITGLGVLSAAGIGRTEFTENVLAGRPGRRPVAGGLGDPAPFADTYPIREFRLRDLLGRKGGAHFDRTTALAVAATELALDDCGLRFTGEGRTRAGVVLGTTTGSIESTSRYTRETLVQERPYLVSAAGFPSTVMNCAAGQTAIWHGLKGVNATLAGGQLSGLLAFRYARKTIWRGQADVMLCGGVEELSPTSAWGVRRARPGGLPPGEASVVFTVEDAGRPQTTGRHRLGEVAACEIGITGDPADLETLAADLASCVTRALDRASVSAESVVAVAGSFRDEAAHDRAEREGIEAALGARPVTTLKIKPLVGECYSAAGALQLAALLATLAEQGKAGAPHGSRRPVGLLTCVGHDGTFGCAVVRGPEHATGDHRS
ncbi:hypothetical protein J4573_02335 [Actinomadura barringtoniae]|uniref:Beta-ketoacyl synthase n=1 Tax=Actinomadura barringtoniae TaxID=1427535 RepID=A0A939P5W3_9ACTN|nr:beta-ketoacyl synthase N-terminal-like domain-containing protein [Actinomadura barringtoniae]MBO2445917.1 hypothetical protein [Actinomadura barringtoniae]